MHSYFPSKTVPNYACKASIPACTSVAQGSENTGLLSLVAHPVDMPSKFCRHFSTNKIFRVNHFEFYSYCWPFTASQGVTINSSSKTVSNLTCVVSILVQAQHKNQKSELLGPLSLVTHPADSPLKFWRHFNTNKIFVLCKNYFKVGFMAYFVILSLSLVFFLSWNPKMFCIKDVM